MAGSWAGLSSSAQQGPDLEGLLAGRYHPGCQHRVLDRVGFVPVMPL